MKVSSTVLKTSTPGDRRAEFDLLYSKKQASEARAPKRGAGYALALHNQRPIS